MLKLTLNNLTIPDYILILEFIVVNYCMFWSIILSLFCFFYLQMPKNMTKTIQEAPKLLQLQWALVSSAPWFFRKSFKIKRSMWSKLQLSILFIVIFFWQRKVITYEMTYFNSEYNYDEELSKASYMFVL